MFSLPEFFELENYHDTRNMTLLNVFKIWHVESKFALFVKSEVNQFLKWFVKSEIWFGSNLIFLFDDFLGIDVNSDSADEAVLSNENKCDMVWTISTFFRSCYSISIIQVGSDY